MGKNPVTTCLKFMEAWKKRDWKKLLKCCQITWVRDGHPTVTAVEWLDAWFSMAAPDKWSVISTKNITETVVDVSLSVIFHNKKIRKTKLIRVICETDSYTPSVDGSWGVNPISCLRSE